MPECAALLSLLVVMRLFVRFDTWQPSNQSSFLVAARHIHMRATSGCCGAAHCRYVGQSLCVCDHRASRVCRQGLAVC